MEQIIEIAKLVTEGGLGAISLALFFKLGQVVANHEIRISKLEDEEDALPVRRRGRNRAR